MLSSGKEPFIFVSYAHLDSDIAMPIINGLKENGFSIWYDNGIEPGSEWPEYIAQKILECSVMLVLLSNNSLASFNCKREVNFAISESKELLVVHLEKANMTPGMKMQLNSNQAIYKYKFRDTQSFLASLYEADLLEKCKKIPPEPDKSDSVTVIEDKAQTDKKDEQKTDKKDETEKSKTNASDEEAVTTSDPTKKAQPSSDIPDLTHNIKEPSSSKKIILSTGLILSAINYCHRKNSSLAVKFETNVSKKQISNAKLRFAYDIDKADVIAFCDTTLLCSGKSGILVTKNAIYSSYLKGIRPRITFSEIKSLKLTDYNIKIIMKSGETSDVYFSVYAPMVFNLLDYIISSRDKTFPDNTIDKTQYARKIHGYSKEKVILAIEHSNNNVINSFPKFEMIFSEKQIANAKINFAKPVRSDDVIAFLDETLSDSGKRGIIVTKNAIYSSYLDGVRLAFSEIKSIELTNESHVKIIMASGRTKGINFGAYAKQVYDLLDYIINK